MKPLSIVIILVVLCMHIQIHAQQDSGVLENVPPYFTFKIAESSDNAFTRNRPGQISATFPGNDTISDSWLLNSFVAFGLNFEKSNLVIGITGEVQKNTLIEKEQDIRQYGLTFTKGFVIPNRNLQNPYGNSIPVVEASRFIISGSLKNSYNKIVKENSFQAHVGVTFSRAKRSTFSFLNINQLFPDENTNFGKVLQFTHNHNVGLGYLGGNENVLFAKLGLQLSAYPLRKILESWIKQNQFLFIDFTYAARTEVSGSTDLETNPYRTLSSGIQYRIDKNNTFQIAYNWIEGANPFTALATQDFQTLVAKIKITLDSKK